MVLKTFSRASDALANYFKKQFPRFCRRLARLDVDIVINENDLCKIEFQYEGEVICDAPFSFTALPPRIKIERYGSDEEVIEFLLPDIYRALDNYITLKSL